MNRLFILTALCALIGVSGNVEAATNLHPANHLDVFEAGLDSLYGFNEAQADRLFERGAQEGCVMCHWGIAYAAARLAIFYQAPHLLSRGSGALSQAEIIATHRGCTPVQSGLLLATRAIYKQLLATPPESGQQMMALADYVDVMRCVHRQFTADPDIATLFATGLLSTTNTSCHHAQTIFLNKSAEIFTVLEPALSQHPNHIGLHHIYIHARELSSHPERALPSAYALPKLAPELGHLVHMPSHIFARLGMYDDAAHANRDAIAVDMRTREDGADHTVYTTQLTLHNYHFLWSMLSLCGEYDAALEIAREVKHVVSELAVPAGSWRDTLLSFDMLSHIEMQRWSEARDTATPPQAGYLLDSLTYLGHGLAALYIGDLPSYRCAREALQSHVRQCTIMTPGATEIYIAESLLEAEGWRLHERWADALAAYHRAISYEDAIGYREPWPWQLPIRNYLAQALIARGAFQEAVDVCEEELAKHPRAPKTTRLLAEALRALRNPRWHTLPGR